MSFIRVFEMPHFIKPNYRFGGGMPMPFTEVDWFRDDQGRLKSETGRREAAEFIKTKRYYKPECAYLVLHPTHPMVINCDEDFLLGRRPRP
jgi:hypothetical protein